MEIHIVILLFAAGIVAGFINTIAGSGSLLTLPLLIFIGLPPTVANATNRIGILLQSIVGAVSFRHQRVFRFREGLPYMIPSVIGAVAGALYAASFNEEVMRRVIGFLLLFMLLMLLIKPERWLYGREVKRSRLRRVGEVTIFLLIGFYGGFIQAGVGFFLIAALVYGTGAGLTRSNALKVLITSVFTLVAVIVFLMTGQIDFRAGLILGAGSMIGAYVGTRVAVEWGPRFVRYFLVVILFVSAIELMGIADLILQRQ